MRSWLPVPAFVALCRALVAVLEAASACGQRWHELQGSSKSGAAALEQSLLDCRSDALALLVASHPDDRYVLPAVHLRYLLGARVAVLLASRGGGGQNSLGPETGDTLDRIRTLEAEAGCSVFDGDVYYLNRPDRGFRRTAAETFAEWGREETLRELVRLIRLIRPDIVLSTHHLEETHGHDLALAEALPEAVRMCERADFLPSMPPHRVRTLYLGATSTPTRGVESVRSDRFDATRGATLRRLAYEILLRHHLSPGAPNPVDTVFPSEMLFEPVLGDHQPGRFVTEETSLFAPSIFAGARADAGEIESALASIGAAAADRRALIDKAAALIRRLQELQFPTESEGDIRRRRRVEALQRVMQQAGGVQVEVATRPGAVAVPGEELDIDVRIHVGGPVAAEGVELATPTDIATFEVVGADTTAIAAGGALQAAVTYRVPIPVHGMNREDRFRGDRFQPPVQLDFLLNVAGQQLPLRVVVPVDERPPVDVAVVPRMLLLPATRHNVKFAVKVERNSAFPVEDELDVRAPAGYRIEGRQGRLRLDSVRGDIFEFTLHAPIDRRVGVDVVNVGFGGRRVVLPVHKVDVEIDPGVRIGIVRSMDDALTSVLGAGGFGLHWVGLSDLDLAVGDLSEFNSIVVDVRALRDRPEARRSFRRLLDFCAAKGKRLVVLYHKDTEFDPPGEGFRGAPRQPFLIGHARVTRADAPVTVLLPQHVLMTTPNQIRVGDWDGWEQERALYLPNAYSEHYEEVLGMHDPGQPQERSALLYVRHGDGEYVYCALALWRQWKKLHPGSVRLLANLLTPHSGGR